MMLITLLPITLVRLEILRRSSSMNSSGVSGKKQQQAKARGERQRGASTEPTPHSRS